MLVVIAADHGEGLQEHGWIGHMKQVHEEAAHVPLILHYPAGKGPRGSRVKDVVSLLDLAPTVADALGARIPAGTFVGRSLLRERTPYRVVTRNTDLEATYAVTEDRYRLIFQTSDRSRQLYDVLADPGERNDVADGRPGWPAAHLQALQRFLLALRPEKPEPIRPLSPADLEAMKALGYVN
jgi:arylsulfatase A-like enzyme